MFIVLQHLLAAYAVLCEPFLGRIWYEKAKKRIAAGEPQARLRFYRELFTEQIGTIAAVFGLWLVGGIAPSRLGISMPRSWPLTLGAMFVIVFALVWSGMKLRSKIEKIRKVLKDQIGVLLPSTNKERRWFAVISVSAGISEELLYRGFLFFYLIQFVPHVNLFGRVVLTGIAFGFAHIYQGWKGVAGTSVFGLIAAGLFVMTGSLLLPIVIHAVNDLRVLLILPPEPQIQSASAP